MKKFPLIRRKYFMTVFGAENWEIFKYSVEYWNKYTKDSNVKVPYLLDGLIYQPLEQEYIANASKSKYHDYKWKPPSKNSIDFYIEFKRDKQTNNILKVYDNSMVEQDDNINEESTGLIRNKLYKICKIHVGNTFRNKEQPVPFEENHGISDVYLYMKDGEVRDMYGDVISDKTVVEFYYINDKNIIPQRRWMPIRTRFDKTESVERYGTKYGNYSGTAKRIWRSIVNPVLMEDFIELSKGNTKDRSFYDIKIKSMNSKISHKLIVDINKQNKYYQVISKTGDKLRKFHNIIKSNLIYTYCNKLYNSNEQKSVLDIACGVGGDLHKFYYTEVEYYVGIDNNDGNLKSPVDGAISRYRNLRKRKPNVPKMYFLQADARGLLDYDSQIKILSGMDDINKKLMKKFFSSSNKTMFDTINCQFAMHYFLENQTSWDNFKQNLKNHLRNGGYFLATTFDAQQVINKLGNNDTFTTYFDDKQGIKRKYFEIVKKYDNTDKITVGKAIDLYASWMFNEGTYVTEYLVDKDFVIEEFKEIGLELVDTDLFENQLEINKDFFMDTRKYESTQSTRKTLTDASAFYEEDELNQKLMMFSKLNRYYVFRMNSKTNKKTQKGGYKKSKYKEKYDFSDTNKFVIPNMDKYNNDYSMINSIHKILSLHSICPKSLRPKDFINDMGFDLVKDHDLTKNYMKELVNGTIVNHEINGNDKVRTKNVLNGLNILLVERDCNNFYDIEYCIKKNNISKHISLDKAIVLMKEGSLYKPILRKDAKGIKGIFKMDDDMIKYLVNNGKKI
jgi:SAM-dependent methyltransferase